MDSQFIVERAIIADIPGILQVRRVAWLRTYPHEELGISVADIEQMVNAKEIGAVEVWSSRITGDAAAATWVARFDNSVIGFVSARKDPGTNAITALYVDPEYQGKGIGKTLMSAALDWLGNGRSVRLNVVRYNEKAIQFYSSFGFIEQGPLTDGIALLPNGEVFPQIVMEKIFQK
jgi:ribosomal protein S18 acetylase RimI-like enzyme